MKILIPYILLISFSITELHSVFSELLNDPTHSIDITNSLPDHEGDNEDDTLKEGLEDNEKVISAINFNSLNHFIRVFAQYKSYKKNYQAPHKKIPVPPPEFS